MSERLQGVSDSDHRLAKHGRKVEAQVTIIDPTGSIVQPGLDRKDMINAGDEKATGQGTIRFPARLFEGRRGPPGSEVAHPAQPKLTAGCRRCQKKFLGFVAERNNNDPAPYSAA